jgi:predicted ATP-binding protein involved in virulence
MHLEQLTLTNFRCFDDLQVSFDERLTVLVAPNGLGKSSVLDAIRIAFWPYVSAFDVVAGTAPNSGIGIDDVLLVPAGPDASMNMEPQLPCKVSAEAIVHGQRVTWSRSRNKVSRGSQTTKKDAAPLAELGREAQSAVRQPEKGAQLQLPIIAYYGTGRMLTHRAAKLPSTKAATLSRTYAHVGGLEPSSDYGAFLDWCLYNFTADNEQKTQEVEQSQYGRQGAIGGGLKDLDPQYGENLRAVAESVERVMTPWGWTGLRYSPSARALVMRHREHGQLKVDQLSDGQRGIIAMVGDIAYRCVRLNPVLGADAPRQTCGIVLIDELDIHLHPQWQQVIAAALCQTFPMLQFIVTTHSPQVLTSIRREQIRMLGRARNGKSVASIPLGHSYGELSSDVLLGIMHVDPLPPIPERENLRTLTALVDQGAYDTKDAQRLLQRLRDQLRPDHPHLQRLERSIRRQKALKR